MSLCQLISNDRLPPPELQRVDGRPLLRRRNAESMLTLCIADREPDRKPGALNWFIASARPLCTWCLLGFIPLGLFLRTRNSHDPPFLPADCAKAQKWRNPWAGVRAKAAAAAMNYLVGPCERLFGSVLCCRAKIWIALRRPDLPPLSDQSIYGPGVQDHRR